MPGATLKAAREAKGSTPGAAAEATRIKVQIIEAIERDDFSRIAAPTYARGFIKLYAEYVGLDPEPLLRAYAEHHLPPDPRLYEAGLKLTVWLPSPSQLYSRCHSRNWSRTRSLFRSTSSTRQSAVSISGLK